MNVHHEKIGKTNSSTMITRLFKSFGSNSSSSGNKCQRILTYLGSIPSRPFSTPNSQVLYLLWNQKGKKEENYDYHAKVANLLMYKTSGEMLDSSS